jgi:hypothetical protein
MLTNLLRFPGLASSPAALTGDSAIDAYLIELDRRLLGSRQNRLAVVLEVRDHLEERRAALLGRGHDELEASREALAAMGPAEAHAAPDRARRWRTFASMVVGCLVLVFAFAYATNDLPAGRTLGESLANRWPFLVPGAILMGWFRAFAYPMRALPSSPLAGPRFAVAYPPTVFVMAYPAIGALLLLAAFNLALALGLESPVSWFGLTRAGALVPLLFCAAILVALPRLMSRRIEVSEDGLRVIGLLGGLRAYPWHAIVGLTCIGERAPWLPIRSYWRASHRLHVRSTSGRGASVFVWPDMANHDLLVERVRDHLASLADSARMTDSLIPVPGPP